MYISSIICISIAYPLLLILIFISVFFLKIYSRKSIGNPSYPPVKGTVFQQLINFNRLYDWQTEVAKKYPTFRLLAPDQSEYYTTDPKNIEYILKSNFGNYEKGNYSIEKLSGLLGQGIFAIDGDKWKEQRKVASFEFSTRVLRDFSCAVFRRKASKLVGIVAQLSKTNQGFDIHDMLMRYTLDSIFKVGFGVDLNCLDNSSKEGTLFMTAFDDANALISWRFVDPTWKIKRILNIGSEASLKRNTKIINNFVHGLINQKRKLMADQQQQHWMEKEDILSRFLLISTEKPDEMNDECLRDIILNFMIAGKDTTGNTLSWLIYILCKNPTVQEKIVQEVRQVLFGSSDNEGVLVADVGKFVELITDEKLEKMHYLHAALSETLRLYPALPVDERSAMADDILPDGYKVKKGDNVYYVAYAMGRMQYLWGDDAAEFRPERWIKNGVFQPESPFKFIAFHAGPRICLGKDFAYRQMKIVSSALLYLFRFRLSDDMEKITYKTMLTLHIDGGLRVKVLPRITHELEAAASS